jgi:molybdopterin molybdotransferase
MVSEPPLGVEEAQARAIALVRRVGAERVAVRAALGRVLAEDIVAPGDVPPEDNSAMDGFAVRAADPGERAVVGEAAAGHPSSLGRAVGAGEAIRIMTGAPLPDGADAVVMVEHTELVGETRVRLGRAMSPGENVRRRGEDIRAGAIVLHAGDVMGPAELGVLASARRAQVAVARRPVVAILSTGDELRDVDQPLGPGAIADTNSYALAALVEEAGGAPRLSAIVPDDPAQLRAAIIDACAADLIVSTGGVSVGEHDHVKSVLAELGAELTFWRVDMKPGKPVAVAQLSCHTKYDNRMTPYYGLPGNPVSAMVSFLLFVRPAIRAALGLARPFDLPRAAALLSRPLQVRGDRRSYLRAQVAYDGDGKLRATVMPQQGSHVLTSMVGANGFVVLEPGAHQLPEGAAVTVQLFRPPR